MAMDLIQMPSTEPHVMARDSSPDDALLLRAYAEHGDRDAMASIFQRHAHAAYRLALRCTGNAADAEDAVQSAFLTVLRCASQFRAESSVRVWIMGILVHACKDRAKSEASRVAREQRIAETANRQSEPEVERRELQAAAVSEVEALPKHYRLPVWLHHLEGLSFKDISTILELPENTVRSQAHRGLEQVREALAAAGFTAGAAALPELLSAFSLAPAPVALTASFTALISNVAQTTGAATVAGAAAAGAKSAAAGGLAVGTKVLLGLSVAALLTAGSFGIWKQRGQPAPAPAPAGEAGPEPAAPPPPPAPPALKEILVIPRGADFSPFFFFAHFHRLGGPTVILLGPSRLLLVPPELRFKSIDLKKLIEAVATHNERKIVWVREGRVAILQRGATDKEVERVISGLKSVDASKRREAAWLAKWVEDVRVLGPLASAGADADPEVVQEALQSSFRLGLQALAASGSEQALFLLVKALKDKRFNWRQSAVSALGQIGGEQSMALLEMSLEDAGLYQDVVFALVQIGGEKALALLEKALENKDSKLRFSATVALGKIDGEKALALMEKALENKDANVRSLAASILVQNGSKKALALLEKSLEDKDEIVRHHAVCELSRIGGEKALVLLKKSLENKDENMRREATSALGNIGGEKALALLEKTLEDKDVNVRQNAAWALVQIGGEKALALLEKTLEDKDVNVRQSAARALGQIDGEKALALMEKALGDKDANVREYAASSLGVNGSEKALALLEKTLDDKEVNVRHSAAWALGHIGGEKALALLAKALERLLEYKDANVRQFAASTLHLLGGEKGLALLEKTLMDKDNMVRMSAASALGQFEREKVLAFLKKTLESQDEDMRGPAAYALGHFGGEKALALLEKALWDKNMGMRMIAAYAIGQIGGEKALALLVKTLEDADADVRKNTAAAIGMIGGEKARETMLKHLPKEKDKKVLWVMASFLREAFGGDPAVEQALKELNLPLPQLVTPVPVHQSQPPAAPDGDF